MSEDMFDVRHRSVQWIAIKNLSVIWANAQRPLDEKFAKQIAEALDPDMFGEIAVTKPNGKGIYHIIDGQHRRAAVLLKYGENEKVPCIILEEVDEARAAVVFERINRGRKAVRQIDSYRVRLTAGYDDEVGVDKIVRALGYHVNAASGPRYISCVGTLCNIHRRQGGDTLRQVLTVIKNIWGHDQTSVNGSIVGGFAQFIAEFGHIVEVGRLVKVMERVTPGQLLGNAKALREMDGVNTHAAIVRLILRYYNKGLRGGNALKRRGD